MTPDRWKQIDPILDAVLDLDPAERPARLQALCSNDEELRREVEKLLQADMPAFLDDDVASFVAPALQTERKNPLPTPPQIGPYTIAHEVGRGGMGVVYLAERPDVGRKVALKLVRGGLGNPGLRDRFLHEQQVLGQLEHPNIARLYDVGIANDGTPYFALEYVEGQPLDAYCDTHRLPLTQRLNLFMEVGRAVQHAHQHFIVHRDLKPSNLLVTVDEAGQPQVKLLDFGIAKVMAEAETAAGQALTQTVQPLMTPAYAAPEQIRGEPVSAATDVYALGVVLYELLTGQRPYAVTGHHLKDAEAVLTLSPPKPSTAVSGTASAATKERVEARATTIDQLQRRLKGDLDVICLKALEKEPQRRYQSAEAFVEDIRRHLEGLPVVARPATARYRLKKFVYRHRQGVLAAVAASMLFLILIGFYTVRLQAQRDVAQLEALKAQEVSRFMLGLFEASDPEEALGDTLTAPELLQRGIEQVEALRSQPQVQAQMLTVIGNAFSNLGWYDRADSLLQQALAIQQHHLGEAHADVAQTLHLLGVLRYQQGDYDEATRWTQESLTLQGQHPGSEANRVESIHHLGLIQAAQGDYDKATTAVETALHLNAALPGHQPLDDAPLLTTLATFAHQQGAYEKADSLHQQAIRLHQQAFDANHPETAAALSSYAWYRYERGDYAAADSIYQRVLDIQRTVFGDAHPALATTLNHQAVALSEAGDLDEARWLHEQALAMRQRLLGNDHLDVATSLNNLATIHHKKGDYQPADSLYRAALAIRRRRLGDTHPKTGNIINNLAVLRNAMREYEAAETLYRESLAVRRATYGEEHPLVAESVGNLGWNLFMQQRDDEAEPLLRESVALTRRTRGEAHATTGVRINNLAKLLERQERYAEAEASYRDALEILKAAVGEVHYFTAVVTGNIGQVCRKQGKMEEAETQLLTSLSLLRQSVGEQHPQYTSIRQHLADLYDVLGNPDEAAKYRGAME